MINIKVLVLCTYTSTYVLQLFKYVREYHPDVKYSLFTHISAKEYYENNLVLSDDETIYSFGNHDYLCGVEAMKLPHFDIIHSLWMERFWGEWAGVFKRKCDAWFCSVGGSDLYRDSSKLIQRILQKRIIRRADWISSEGEETKEFFNNIYGAICDNTNHTIIRYGVDILDAIDDISGEKTANIKEKYGISPDKIVIMCGTNSRVEHQHMAILHALSLLPEDVRDRIALLIPMTYGGGTKAYIEQVGATADNIAETVVLTHFLSTREMAEIAKATDIMIHVQTTDQLSSAMLSNMYNGNVVIAGEWLPYNELRDKGIYFISVDCIEELNSTIMTIIDNLGEYKERCKENKNKVYEISSWKKSAFDWYSVYEKIVRDYE